MRIAIAAILVLLTFSIAAGQISLPIEGEVYQSARLRAMGQANIANPDLQTEMFLNPAKMTQLTGIFLFANPMYSRNNISEEWNSSGSTSTNFDKYEYTYSNIGVTAGGCASLGIIAVGGYISQQKSGYEDNDEYGYKYIYSNYTHTYTRKSEYTSNYPSTSIALQAGLSLGPIAVGLSGSLLNGTETNNSKSSYLNTYLPPMYASGAISGGSEDEVEIANKGKSLTAGALLDLGDLIEASLSAKFSSFNTEEKPTKSIVDGYKQSITEPYISYAQSTSKDYNANVRINLSESFTLGSSLSYIVSNTDNSEKDHWGSLSIYEERETRKYEGKSIIGGIGLTFRSSSSILTAEFLLGKLKGTYKTIETYDTYVHSSITYKRGDTYGESITDNNLRILRVGGEFTVFTGIQGRLGAEYTWIIRGEESWYGDPKYKGTLKGSSYGYLYPSAGISIDLAIFTIDYALSVYQTIGSSSISMSSPYLYVIYPDFIFRHLITATIKI